MSKLIQIVMRGTVDLSEYDQFQKGTARMLRRLAKPLRGTRVMHVNATAQGGGVAELLQSQVPFERALGLESRWYAMDAPESFFAITKHLHDLLQGASGSLSENDKSLYRATNGEFASSLTRIMASFRPDVVVIHDPQPVPLIVAAAAKAPVVARLHGDLLTPNPQTMEFVRPFLAPAKKVVVSNRDYLAGMPWLPARRAAIIYPAIDPLSEKNKDLAPEVAHKILEEFGVNQTKPLIAQVSRFDPWKDPLGVIQAYYRAKNKIPDLQLVLSGLFLAHDDPEARAIFRAVQKHAKGDRDIFLFADPRTTRQFVADDLLVSAIYTASTLMVQKSLREGFGLTMTEAMWKGKAVIAGATSGAKVQIKDGRTGIMVSSPEEAARAIIETIKDETMRRRLGRAARESVRRRFLMPRFIADNLKLYAGLG